MIVEVGWVADWLVCWLVIGNSAEKVEKKLLTSFSDENLDAYADNRVTPDADVEIAASRDGSVLRNDRRSYLDIGIEVDAVVCRQQGHGGFRLLRRPKGFPVCRAACIRPVCRLVDWMVCW